MKPVRKKMRLTGWDYSGEGTYFLTLCAKNRKPVFSRMPRPTDAVVAKMISSLKRFSNRQTGQDLWQSGYYDHIIRDEQDFLRRWQYIKNNPAKWLEDDYFVEQLIGGKHHESQALWRKRAAGNVPELLREQGAPASAQLLPDPPE